MRIADGDLRLPPRITPKHRPKPTTASRVSNGSSLLHNVDGRSVWARRAKDLIQAHIADLGGAENISSAELSLVRRAATIATELERRESEFAKAGEVRSEDLETFARVSSQPRRLLETLGLKRRAKDVTPDLHTYLRNRESAA